MPLLTDTYTGTAGTDLAAHTSDNGVVWAKHPSSANGLVISPSGQVRNAGSGEGLYMAAVAASSAAYFHEQKLVAGAATSQTTVWEIRVGQDPTVDTAYRLAYLPTGGAVYLLRQNAGSQTQLATTGYALPNGTTPLFRLGRTINTNGDPVLSVSINGTVIPGLAYTDTDKANQITAVGRPAILTNGAATDTAGLFFAAANADTLGSPSPTPTPTPTPTPSPTPTVTSFAYTSGQLWDNGLTGTDGNHPSQSEFSRAVHLTTATSATVTVDATQYASFPAAATIGVRVDGVDSATLACTAAGLNTLAVSLPNDGAQHRVEFVGGQQIAPDSTQLNPQGTTLLVGTYLAGSAFTGGTTTLVSPAPSNVTLTYVDSIGSGGVVSAIPLKAWNQLLRASREVQVDGWAGRSLFENCSTPSAVTAEAARVAAMNPAAVIDATQTNDYGLNRWSAASYQTALASLWDQFHAARPNAVVVLQTALTRTDTTAANSFGNVLEDYRAAKRTVAAARSSWMRVVEGPSIMPAADLSGDGLHPGDAGHAAIAAYYTANLPTILAPVATSATLSPSTGGGSVTLNAGDAGFNSSGKAYLWVPGPGVSLSSTTAAGPTATVTAAGSYTATVTVSDSTGASVTRTLTFAVGVGSGSTSVTGIAGSAFTPGPAVTGIAGSSLPVRW